MALPEIVTDTSVYHINLTILLAIITFCLTAMATLVKIFGAKLKEEEKPGTNFNCIKHIENVKRIELECKEKFINLNNKFKENTEGSNKLKDIIRDLDKEIALLKREAEATNQSIDEIKSGNKALATRLDDLLRQLMDFAAS